MKIVKDAHEESGTEIRAAESESGWGEQQALWAKQGASQLILCKSTEENENEESESK